LGAAVPHGERKAGGCYPSGKDDWMITVDMHRKLLQSYENRIKD
jgi:hypothetical protein